MARQAIASYVAEIVIDPGEKTATLAVNAGFGPPEGGAGQQKPNDPPGGGSQVTVIAGARFGSNLRPHRYIRLRFRWGERPAAQLEPIA